jgi:hypothetical protein
MKSKIGWILAGLIILVCLVVIIVGGIYSYNLNNDLSNSKADLARAKESIGLISADLDKSESKNLSLTGQVTGLTGQLTEAKTALTDMTTQKTAIETRFNKTVCKTTKEFDYSSMQNVIIDAALFTTLYHNVGAIQKISIGSDFLGTEKMWIIEIAVTTSDSKQPNGLIFLVFPDKKATFFGNEACWLQAPV